MVKNIIIVILTVATIFFLILSNLKANEADKQRIMVEEATEVAEQTAAEARKAEVEAVLAKREADLARDDALLLAKQLAACQNGK